MLKKMTNDVAEASGTILELKVLAKYLSEDFTDLTESKIVHPYWKERGKDCITLSYILINKLQNLEVIIAGLDYSINKLETSLKDCEAK